MSENGANGEHPPENGNGMQPPKTRTGRAPKKVDRDYLSVAKSACTLEDWMEIVRKAVTTAKDPPGTHPVAVAKSRDFLLKALSVEQAVKVHLSGSLDSDEGRRRLVLDAQDPATLALVADLANRVYGPKTTPPTAPTNGNGNGSHEKM